ncbi:MAG: hypothetical protein R3C56_13135 [Pirellulaceae bacterium]
MWRTPTSNNRPIWTSLPMGNGTNHQWSLNDDSLWFPAFGASSLGDGLLGRHDRGLDPVSPGNPTR